jgi:hypothetical protein
MKMAVLPLVSCEHPNLPHSTLCLHLISTDLGILPIAPTTTIPVAKGCISESVKICLRRENV